MIIQPARAKYLEILVKRRGKTIWKNYKKDPSEDSQGYFAMHFFKEGKPATLPNHADSVKANNLQGKEERTLHYRVPGLQSGDEVVVSLYVLPAKGECSRLVSLQDKQYTTPLLLKRNTVTLP